VSTALSKAQWNRAVLMDSDDEIDTYSQLDKRRHYLLWRDLHVARHQSEKSRPVAQYVQAFKDKDGNRFDGEKTYRLRVPANAPISAFWSQTPYETETPSMIQNPGDDSALASYDTIKSDAVPANQLLRHSGRSATAFAGTI